MISDVGVAVARLGILPGTFNPPTRAHLALARAALRHVDVVMMVLPGVLPHKAWEGATLEQRAEMLRAVTEDHPRLGAAVSSGGLAVEMVREAREIYRDAEFRVICGRDAAERFLGWDYGEEDMPERMLREFGLLVAPRHGGFEPPPHLAGAIETLDAGCWDEYSSTTVREGALDLVPDEIREMVTRIYLRGR